MSKDELNSESVAHSSENHCFIKAYTQEDTRELVRYLIANRSEAEIIEFYQSFAKPDVDILPKDSLLSLSCASYDSKHGATTFYCGGKDLFHPENVDENTKYNIGSISKFILTAIIMRLLDKGEISLDESVGKLINKNKVSSRLWEHFTTITIAQLMSHCSGLRDRRWGDYYKNDPLDDFVKVEGEANEFYYANCNYVLLAYIVEVICAASLAEVFATCVAHPLQLHNTIYAKSTANTLLRNAADGYIVDANGQRKRDYVFMFGAVCFYSTPKDIAKLLYHFFNDPSFISQRTLQIIKDSVKFQHYEVKTPHATFAWDAFGGMGIERFTYADGHFHNDIAGLKNPLQFYGHGGWTNGSATFAVYGKGAAYCAMLSKAHVSSIGD